MKVKRGDGLNVVPFIDIMLVLLALVLSISTFISQGKIKVDVPNASNTQEEKNEDNNPISIIISSENKFYISDEEVDELRLEAFIREIPNDKMINFRGDRNSSLEKLVFVIEQLTKKGHEHDKFRIDTQRN